MSREIIPCSFSLLDTGRKYSGNHRQYVIENAIEICSSAATRERIKNREALGYYGHGRRLISGKFDLPEEEMVQLPDGTNAMVSHVPSNVTTKLSVSADGTVTHEQEILETEPGKIVSGLNRSHVGGFSWACPGKDGRSSRTTILTGFSGFDYVLHPGFNANRGYVLESASKGLVLESVAAVVRDDKRAEQLVAGWIFESKQAYVADLEDIALESQHTAREKGRQVQSLTESLRKAQGDLRAEKEKFRGILENIAEQLPFIVPDNAMHAMLEGDFSRARGIFESAKAIDYSQYPLDKKQTQPPLLSRREPPAYGTAAYGWGMDL